MLKKYLTRLMLITSLSLSLITIGCDSQGPAEKAGEKIDNTVEATKDAMDEVADKATGEGPAEKLGEKLDETAEEVEKSVNSGN
jgi:hypothetical protein